MRNLIRGRRPNAAMIVAIVALIAALAGTAVAGGGFLTKKSFNKLTKEQPKSDPVPSDQHDGYHVMQLTGVTDPRPQTLEEVKAKLTEALKRERTSEKLNARAAEVRTAIDTAVKAGQSFE